MMRRIKTTRYAPPVEQLLRSWELKRTARNAPPARPRFIPQSITGPVRVRTADAVIMLPEGAKVAHSHDLSTLYVSYARRIHVITSKGELTGIPRAVIDAIAKEHFT
jgi:hypothetical protein